MPELYRRPRRRTGGGARVAFTSEGVVRAAVDEVRSAYPTVDAAEQSREWRELKPSVGRWVLSEAKHPPLSEPEAWALKVARIYLRSPHLLPALPPESAEFVP